MYSNILNIIKLFYFKLSIKFLDGYKRANKCADYYGFNIGNNVRFTGEIYFGTEPYLITIGDNVTIANNTTFVNHDGSSVLFRNEFPDINIYGEIVIGNNVFIGVNTIIMPGVTIGDDIIVGAGSIVTKSLLNKGVYAGIPARFIKSLNEHKNSVNKRGICINEKNPYKRKNIIINHLKARKNI